MIILPNSPHSKQIFQLSAVFHVVVRVEAYRTTGPSQCHNCQGFGHSSTHCGLPPKCVKCGGNHLTKTCSKTRDEPAKCCNCSGDHTANYRSCPSYSAQVELINKSRAIPSSIKQPTPAIPVITNPPQCQPLSSDVTYAKVTSNSLTNTLNHQDTHKNSLISLLTDTISQISTSTDIKQTIMTALSTMLTIIQNV